MNDPYTHAEFQAIHTLRRRIGTSRPVEEHPYQPVITGLSSLAARPRQHRLRPLLHARPNRDRR
jgi:hypothetical protein